MKGSDRFFVEEVSCAYDGRVLPVANLSVGGFFVASESLPSPGQVLEMVLELAPRPPCRVLTKVTWIHDGTKSRSPGLPVGFGVKILQIPLADTVAIIDLLKRVSRARGPSRT